MKKLILILLLLPVFVFAQKPVKPTLKGVLQLYREGKLNEAKEMVEMLTTNEKTMNDGKTYFYRGLIYAAIDTTSDASIKAIAPNALDIAMESFKKADELKKGNSEYSIADPADLSNVMAGTKSAQLEQFANRYLQNAINSFQADEPDYTQTIVNITKSEKIFKTLESYGNDTLAYYVMALAAQADSKYDTALEAVSKFRTAGGKGKEGYIIEYQAWMSEKKNKNREKALEVIQAAKKAFPDEDQFGMMELGLLIDLDRKAEAKAGLENAIKKTPTDKTLHFYLGYINMSDSKIDEAKKSFEEALRLDPKYFEAQFYLAKIATDDAIQVKKQINALGITAADRKKKMDLDVVYVQKLKSALPYWEKAEKLNPSDQDVLDVLYDLYADLGMDTQVQRVKARMKELGIER